MEQKISKIFYILLPLKNIWYGQWHPDLNTWWYQLNLGKLLYPAFSYHYLRSTILCKQKWKQQCSKTTILCIKQKNKENKKQNADSNRFLIMSHSSTRPKGYYSYYSLRKISRGTFETNVIVHEILPRALAPCLCQINRIILPFRQNSIRNVHIKQPVQSMDAVSSHCVVPSDQSAGKQWPVCVRIIHAHLEVYIYLVTR